MNYWDLPAELRKEVDAFRFKTQLRVRFAETDAQGVVYNGAFLTYLDVARVEYHRNLNLLRSQMPEKWWDGTVAETHVHYVSPARFDDPLTIYVRCAWMRERSLGYAHLIFNEDTGRLVARATSGHVTLDGEAWKPIPIPTPLRERLMGFDGDRILTGDAAPKPARPRLREEEVPDALEKFKFKDWVRVRFAETDAQGIVYNGTFFTYLEVGRVSYIRSLLGEMTRNEGRRRFDISAVAGSCSFRSPARFDEILDIHVRVPRVGRTSFAFEYLIVSRTTGRLIATGETVMVCLEDGRPTPVPDPLRDLIRAFEGPDSEVPTAAEALAG